MDVVSQFLVNTPWWVYVLFAYLVFRGIKGRKPADVTLQKLAIIPVLFTAWSLIELVRLYGVAVDAGVIWLAGLAIGVGVGIMILRNAPISVSVETGMIHRPADFTLLPLIIATFFIKYTFGVITAVSPDLMMQPGFRLVDLGLSGLVTGIFVGKFAIYANRYHTARA